MCVKSCITELNLSYSNGGNFLLFGTPTERWLYFRQSSGKSPETLTGGKLHDKLIDEEFEKYFEVGKKLSHLEAIKLLEESIRDS